jgi:hypothetical protein
MNPSRLHILQEHFHAYLLSDEDEPTIQAAIVDDARVGLKRRLKIYHDAYRLRLIAALSEAYPNLGKLLGDDLFDQIARSYISAHPSAYRNLRWYGGELAEHLASALPQHPIASELARFEWALALAFDSADVSLLTRANLADIPPEGWHALRFCLHPSVQILDMTLNTVAVWKALDSDQIPPDVEHVPSTWLVWRHDLNPHFRSLDTSATCSLKQIMQGAYFSDVCEALLENHPESEIIGQAAQYLVSWLDDGLITQLK